MKMTKITFDYMDTCKIRINLDKTSYMKIGNPKIIDKQMIINGTKISEVYSMTILVYNLHHKTKIMVSIIKQ